MAWCDQGELSPRLTSQARLFHLQSFEVVPCSSTLFVQTFRCRKPGTSNISFFFLKLLQPHEKFFFINGFIPPGWLCSALFSSRTKSKQVTLVSSNYLQIS